MEVRTSALTRRRKNTRRAVHAYENIRNAILSGELASGALITEAALVRMLEMSRTPVREALNRLQAERLVEGVPGLGWVIVEVSEEDLVDLYTVRASLESLAAEHASTRVSKVDIATLEELYDGMTIAVGEDDDGELFRLNGQFHGTIARASGNKYLQQLLTGIRESFERYRLSALDWPGRRQTAHAEHGELLTALTIHDAKRAGRLAKSHVLAALEVRRSSVAASAGLARSAITPTVSRHSSTSEGTGHEGLS